MNFLPGGLYHVYNQGNNQQPIFFGLDNYLFFLKKMNIHLRQHCEIIAWCLMPNHFHWLLYIPEKYDYDIYKTENQKVVLPLNRSISTLLSSYSKAVNKSRGMSGSLFRARTKAILLNSEDEHTRNYPLICFLYIHQNPLRAGLSKTLDSWKFSSFKDYASIRNGSLCNIELGNELLDLPSTIEEFLDFSIQTIPEEYIDKFSNDS